MGDVLRDATVPAATVGSLPLHDPVMRRPDLPPRWPSAVRTTLERRHAELWSDLVTQAAAESTSPAVLDLSLADARQRVVDVLGAARRTGRTTIEGGPFDVVISVAGLVRFADLPGAVELIGRSLVDGGRFIAVEPDHRPGMAGLLAGSFGALLPPCRGVHLGRDLPAALRAAGLRITVTRRTTMPTMLWPLRPTVTVEAYRAAAGTMQQERPS